MAIKLGRNAKIYYDVSGVANGSFTEITSVLGDSTLSSSKAETALSRRQDSGYELTVGGLISTPVEFSIPWDPAATGFTTLEDSYVNGTVIGIAAMDGDIDGSTPVFGLLADMVCTNFERGEPIGSIQQANVTMKPALSDTPPRWWATMKKALPASTGSVQTEYLYLGPSPAGTLEIAAPALTTGELPDGETVTYDIQVDTTSDFATPTTLVDDAITQTGAGGAGAAADSYSASMPAGAETYVRLVVTTSAGAGDCSGKKARFSLKS